MVLIVAKSNVKGRADGESNLLELCRLELLDLLHFLNAMSDGFSH